MWNDSQCNEFLAMSPTEQVNAIIRMVQLTYAPQAWRSWSEKWLSGKDRSSESTRLDIKASPWVANTLIAARCLAWSLDAEDDAAKYWRQHKDTAPEPPVDFDDGNVIANKFYDDKMESDINGAYAVGREAYAKWWADVVGHYTINTVDYITRNNLVGADQIQLCIKDALGQEAFNAE